MSLLIRSVSKVILPVTVISSSLILRRNKKLKKKYRRMLRILQVITLGIVGYQNLPLLKALIKSYYFRDSTDYIHLIHKIVYKLGYMQKKVTSDTLRRIVIRIYHICETGLIFYYLQCFIEPDSGICNVMLKIDSIRHKYPEFYKQY
jgi:hypothetical protein